VIQHNLNPFCYPIFVGSSGSSIEAPIIIDDPQGKTENKPPRKRPKTQGEMRLDVQEMHLAVLKAEKEKMEIETGNLFLQRRKLELQVQLLERKVKSVATNVEEPFTCPVSPIF
jgi:hypothetical protein